MTQQSRSNAHLNYSRTSSWRCQWRALEQWAGISPDGFSCCIATVKASEQLRVCASIGLFVYYSPRPNNTNYTPRPLATSNDTFGCGRRIITVSSSHIQSHYARKVFPCLKIVLDRRRHRSSSSGLHSTDSEMAMPHQNSQGAMQVHHIKRTRTSKLYYLMKISIRTSISSFWCVFFYIRAWRSIDRSVRCWSCQSHKCEAGDAFPVAFKSALVSVMSRTYLPFIFIFLHLTEIALARTPWKATPFNPPSVPLAVRSPYLSCWLNQKGGGQQLTENNEWPTFWTGTVRTRGCILTILIFWAQCPY